MRYRPFPHPPFLSPTLAGQPECGHLCAVAYQQDITCQHRVIPGFSFDRRDTRQFSELLRDGLDQHQIAFFRNNQQQILICQQDELTAAIAATFPLSLTFFDIDAGERAAVKSVDIPFVND